MISNTRVSAPVKPASSGQHIGQCSSVKNCEVLLEATRALHHYKVPSQNTNPTGAGPLSHWLDLPRHDVLLIKHSACASSLPNLADLRYQDINIFAQR